MIHTVASSRRDGLILVDYRNNPIDLVITFNDETNEAQILIKSGNKIVQQPSGLPLIANVVIHGAKMVSRLEVRKTGEL